MKRQFDIGSVRLVQCARVFLSSSLIHTT